MAQIRIEGLTELEKALLRKSKDKQAIQRVVRKNGSDLNALMQRNAVFVKGYSTGATQRSIRLEMKDNDFTAIVAPHTDYSIYLEYGTRFMEAQPFIQPSFRKQREIFIKDLKELVK